MTRAARELVYGPFTVLIDSAESQPFSFQGFYCDADKKNLPLVVPTRWQSLGRYPDSRGDYSIDGLTDHVGVERKGLEDCISTVLGWNSDYEIERGLHGRRERFKKELENLAALRSSMVIVEANIEKIISAMPGCDGENYVELQCPVCGGPGSGEINQTRGVKTVAENRKIFFRSYVSWTERYKVNWVFCNTRRAAEIFTYRFLEKTWEHLTKDERRDATDKAESYERT